MKRYRQTIEELVEALSTIQTSWRDAHSEAVIRAINNIPQRKEYDVEDLGEILDRDFEAGFTTVRLALDLSKDEFSIALRSQIGPGGIGVTRYQKDRSTFLSGLVVLGALDAVGKLANQPISWRDILVERLKSGRGSAIKGQLRGRYLEDFTERIVQQVFTSGGYDARCRFVGANGTSTEKADFAIPSRQDARILIEVKAYGATGSKQTDILGDIRRIVDEKRNDTHLLLVTDGISWKSRVNDLRKLVEMQNRGLIARIYTHNMANDLLADLEQLKKDHSL